MKIKTRQSKIARSSKTPPFMQTHDFNKFKSKQNEILALAIPLFNGSKKDALAWLNEPTSLLFGVSPNAAIATGEGNLIIAFLKTRSAKVSGSAF